MSTWFCGNKSGHQVSSGGVYRWLRVDCSNGVGEWLEEDSDSG